VDAKLPVIRALFNFAGRLGTKVHLISFSLVNFSIITRAAMMIKTSRSGVGLLVRLLAIIHACSAQSMVEPPTKAPEDTIKDCTSWVVGTENDTCESLAEDNFVDLEDFVTWVRIHSTPEIFCFQRPSYN